MQSRLGFVFVTGLAAFLLVAPFAWGQLGASAIDEPSFDEEPVPAEDDAGSSSFKPDDDIPRSGDTITLKNGRSLTGVQVVRETPMTYVVELLGDRLTLDVPKSQVQSVDYDDIDPNVQRRIEAQRALRSEEEVLVSGQRLSAKVQDLLATKLTEPPLKVGPQSDVVAVLEQVNKRVGGGIVIHDSIRTRKPPQREWAAQVDKPDLTLESLLQDDLVKNVQNVDLVYQEDAIVVAGTMAAEQMKNDMAEAPEPTPPPEPAEEQLPSAPSSPEAVPLEEPPAPLSDAETLPTPSANRSGQ